MKLISSEEKNRIIERLENMSGEKIDHSSYKTYHSMTWDDVNTLASNDLFAIGAHSRTHPILSKIDINNLTDEIIGCKTDIESRIDRKVTDFAYPNGRLIDINEEAVRISKTGYRSAATTVGGLNSFKQNPYMLKRIGIGRNLEFKQFKLMLSGI